MIFMGFFFFFIMIIRERGFAIGLSVLCWMGRKSEQCTIGCRISTIIGEIIQRD